MIKGETWEDIMKIGLTRSLTTARTGKLQKECTSGAACPLLQGRFVVESGSTKYIFSGIPISTLCLWHRLESLPSQPPPILRCKSCGKSQELSSDPLSVLGPLLLPHLLKRARVSKSEEPSTR